MEAVNTAACAESSYCSCGKHREITFVFLEVKSIFSSSRITTVCVNILHFMAIEFKIKSSFCGG
jgi:hypothetical protein